MTKTTKGVLVSVFLILLVQTISVGYAHSSSCPNAIIWTENEGGSRIDKFGLGEKVYLSGSGLNSSKRCFWILLDLDNVKVKKIGWIHTDAEGNFSHKYIWTIPANDYPNHNYQVILFCGVCGYTCNLVSTGFQTIPEFPTIAIPAIAVIGLVMLMRRRS